MIRSGWIRHKTSCGQQSRDTRWTWSASQSLASNADETVIAWRQNASIGVWCSATPARCVLETSMQKTLQSHTHAPSHDVCESMPILENIVVKPSTMCSSVKRKWFATTAFHPPNNFERLGRPRGITLSCVCTGHACVWVRMRARAWAWA